MCVLGGKTVVMMFSVSAENPIGLVVPSFLVSQFMLVTV